VLERLLIFLDTVYLDEIQNYETQVSSCQRYLPFSHHPSYEVGNGSFRKRIRIIPLLNIQTLFR